MNVGSKPCTRCHAQHRPDGTLEAQNIAPALSASLTKQEQKEQASVSGYVSVGVAEARQSTPVNAYKLLCSLFVASFAGNKQGAQNALCGRSPYIDAQ